MKEEEILKLLGNVLAQEDENFLRYSVRREELVEQLASESREFLIINAPRGSGKSGLLLLLNERIKRFSKSTGIVIDKFYDDVEFPKEELSINHYISFWKNVILGWIVSEIGKRKKFAISDDSISAVEHAEKTGAKEKTLINSILNRVKFNGLPIEKTDFDSSLNDSVALRIINDSGYTFWMLFDEFDDFYEASDEQNNRLVGLLQACRVLSMRFRKNIKIRLTIRPHILTILKTRNEKVQTFWQNEININWTPSLLLSVIARRIIEYEDPGSFQQEDFKLTIDQPRSTDELNRVIISRYFDDFDMSFRPDKKSSYRAMVTLSFGRPRWLLEFCHHALRQSPESRRADVLDMRKAMHDYGHNRVNFIVGEYRYQCNEIESIINRISSLRKQNLGSTLELKKLIEDEILDTGIVNCSVNRKRDRASSRIARILYMTEFIRARQNLGGRDDHRFLYFNDRPELLENWSDHKNVSWHLHPTFSIAMTIDDLGTFRKGTGINLVGVLGERKKKKQYAEQRWKDELEKLKKKIEDNQSA